MATPLISLYIFTEAGLLDVAEDIKDVPENAILLGRIDARAEEFEIANADWYARIQVLGMLKR